jgi:hypothetical protein
MSDTLSSLRRRLDKIDEQIAARKRRDKLVNCDCQEVRIVVHSSENHEEEEETRVQPCPVHGFGRLEHVIDVRFVSPDQTSGGEHSSGADPTLGT